MTYNKLSLNHDLHKSISLQNGNCIWTYVYGGKPKPYFHPLCTPAGHCLTLFEPHDHLWHRGLWFTIKYINGDNFWEERDPMGIQRTEVPPTIRHRADGAIIVSSELNWISPKLREPVIREKRRFTWSVISDDAYLIDFQTSLEAQQDLLLDRTPFTTWGGYGGLIFRGNRNWQETRLLFPDGSTSDRPTGVRHNWADLSGKLDGGIEQSGGIALFDRPENVRYPSPWYGATGSGHYINAAFLFHEPLNVSAGETLEFRYGVVAHDGIWEVDRLNDAYQRYAITTSDSHLLEAAK